MSKLLVVTLALQGFLATAAWADTLDMSPAEARERFEQPGKPARGMSQERVERDFGEPQSRQSAVGEPPISRWEYADFIVYFEYDKVIHSVSKR
jgi:hypothetical protein